MSRSRQKQAPAKPTELRCAIYTRKSTEEGLEQEFNSLDAQRESGEAYIKSQAAEGWTCLADHYDDGGFTGGNMDRPALRRLMADIQAGKFDCVVVYKVDRLSRSLLDFAKMMETFDKHQVAFVSVTQQFNTSTSMGRLVLNVLLSFAQFEREIISERTRDKIAAARRKGKWSGGMPLLGYDVDPRGSKLMVNEEEAARVRAIFQLYLEHESLLLVVQELERRDWRNKQWITRKGHPRGGKPFFRQSLYKLLTNVTYLDKVVHKQDAYEGEHTAIVDADVWQRVQAMLHRNAHAGGLAVRNQFGAILKGLLRCSACDTAMIPTHATKNGIKRYRYYVCCGAQRRGWHTCPSKSIPASEIERFVVDQIKDIGLDPELLHEVLRQAREQAKRQLAELDSEQRRLQRELKTWNGELQDLLENAAGPKAGSTTTARKADLQDRIRVAERRATEVREESLALQRQIVDKDEVAQALAAFEPVWDALTHREQTRVMHLLVQRIDYNGATGKIAITFHPLGIKTLAEEHAA